MTHIIEKQELENWNELDENKPGLRISSTSSMMTFEKNLNELERTKDNILEILQNNISPEQKRLLEELVEK